MIDGFPGWRAVVPLVTTSGSRAGMAALTAAVAGLGRRRSGPRWPGGGALASSVPQAWFDRDAVFGESMACAGHGGTEFGMVTPQD